MHYSFAMDKQPPKKKRFWRKALYALLALPLLCVLGVIAWAATGPHSVAWVKQDILKNLNGNPDLFKVEIEDVVLQFDGWKDPLAIHAINSNILLPGGQLFTTIPDIDLRVDWWALLQGELVLSEIRVKSPSMYLHRSADGYVMIGNNEGESSHTVPVSVLLSGLNAGGAGKAQRPDIIIEEATLRLYSEKLKSSVDVNEGYIALRYFNESYLLNARLPLNYQQHFVVRLNGEYDLETTLYNLSASFDEMPLKFGCLWMDVCEGYQPLDALLEGTVDVSLSDDASLPRIAFAATTKNAKLGNKQWFAEPLEFTQLSLRGSLNLADDELHLAQLVGSTKDFSFKADGQLFYEQSPGTLLLNASLENMAVGKIAQYWPNGLAEQTREWVTTRITKGAVPLAELAVKLEPKHHESEFFPAEILSASIKVKDAELLALPGAPVFKKVNADVHFTGEGMTVKGSSARLGELSIQDIRVAMPNLNDPNVPTKTAFSFSGAVPDAITLLQSDAFTFDDTFGLSADAAKGAIEGKISLDFDAFSEKKSGDSINWDAVQYNVQTKLSDVFYPDFMGKADLGGLSATLQTDNKQFSLQGEGRIDGAALSGSMAKKSNQPMEYKAKGNVSAQLLTRYGLPVAPYVEGLLYVDAHVTDTALFPTVDATIDAKNALLKADDILWQKPSGMAARIAITTKPDSKQGQGIIYANIDAQNMQAIATLAVDPKSEALKRVDVSKLIYGENDLRVIYEPLQNGEFVELRGKQLDLRPHLAQETKQSISNFPPLHLVADLQQVLLANDQQFSNVRGKLFCTTERCNSAEMRGEISKEKSFLISIENNANNVRELDIFADDAGSFFRAFDIVGAMQGGVLEITGKYDDNKDGNPFAGRFLISDFVLKNAPVLGKILNLASLSGLFDTLSGKGMRFDKLAADLWFAKDVAKLSKAIMKGSSVGVTADGVVRIGEATIDMKGTVIPAYALNSLVGEIPVIGELITGGKHQGVLGVDYTVKGPYKKPVISVNPLSAFTPGFLRNIFDIFDAPDTGDIPVPDAAKEEIIRAPTPTLP